ncbi:ATP-binding protein, partial [Amycolatopsis mediterranei]
MSLEYLFERLARLEQRIRDAVDSRRAADPNPDDPFRGLYLSNETIDALLEGLREPFTPFTDSVPDGRLRPLAERAGLTGVDVELLLVALAPDLDSRFEQFYGYLNDDVTRRRASAGLALRLCGIPEATAAGRARLDAD